MTFRFAAPGHLLQEPITIVVAGAGGTGSQFADSLASMETTLRALGHPGFVVTVLDPDRVSPANLGRQRFTYCDVGRYKSELLVHRINQFYNLTWRSIPERLRATGLQCDLLVTCTDSATFRAQIGCAYARTTSKTLWLDCGNGASQAQVILGHLGRAPGDPKKSTRLPNVFDLFPELATMGAADLEEPSCSMEEAITRQEWPVNRAVAIAASTLLWNLLRKGGLNDHGVFLNTTTLASSPLPVDAKAWAMFGYEKAA